jgi:hypothetical protein
MAVPRSQQRICLQQGLKLDFNLLARQGLIVPGSITGPHAIRWVNSDGEAMVSGWISADMRGDVEGVFHIQIGEVDQAIPSFPFPAIMAADSGSFSALKRTVAYRFYGCLEEQGSLQAGTLGPGRSLTGRSS